MNKKNNKQQLSGDKKYKISTHNYICILRKTKIKIFLFTLLQIKKFAKPCEKTKKN